MELQSSYKVFSGQEITDELFQNMLILDKELFPEDSEYALSPEYLKSLYAHNRDGLFFLLHTDTNQLIGYHSCIIVSDNAKNDYISSGNYRKLEHAGTQRGDNNLYIFTLGLRVAYRGSSAMKLLGKAFANWIVKNIAMGNKLKFCFSEAVSTDGARSLTHGMGMVPLDPNKIDQKGRGFYFSPDNLENYTKKMIV